MELRDVNYKVDNLINKSLNLLKSELLVEIKIKEEISEIYINAFEKIRVDLNRLRNVFLENKKLSSNEKEYIHNCGWHFSFLGGSENIKYKIASYGHQELNVPYVIDNIQSNVDSLRDPFFRPDFKIRVVDILPETHPQYLIDNLDKYDKLIYKG